MRQFTFAGMFAVLIAVLAIGPVGCASTTQFTSEPDRSLVRVDNVPIGETPVSYTDSSVWVWTNRHVTVERRGYDPSFSRISGEFVPGYIALGVVMFFCFFPMAWIALIGQFRAQYHYVLRKKPALETALVEHPVVDFAQ